MENIKLQNTPQNEAFRGASQGIITQEMVEGEYAGKVEKILKWVFKRVVSGKANNSFIESLKNKV